MKKNGSWKKKILYSVTAAVLFVLLLVLFFPGDREYQRIPYDVVFLGDSVYGLCRDETSIAAKLQEKTGLKCYNGGLGGTVLGRADAERRLGYTKDINIIGNGPKALADITMVADNDRIDNGTWTCGKDGQSCPVTCGMPSALVSKLTVGGEN